MRQKKESAICEYFSCQVAKISGRNCGAGFEETCQTYKFYERYGEDYMGLGTGAMMVAPGGLERKA